jgi:hypothetical protein
MNHNPEQMFKLTARGDDFGNQCGKIECDTNVRLCHNSPEADLEPKCGGRTRDRIKMTKLPKLTSFGSFV